MIEVRRATAADADAIWPLTQQFATSFEPERAALEDTIASLVGREDAFLAVGVSTGSTSEGAVGYVLAVAHPTLFADAPVAWVEEVMVREVGRRSGVGRALMDAVETWARELGAAYVSLATRRASDFYLALGYQESATFFRKPLN